MSEANQHEINVLMDHLNNLDSNLDYKAYIAELTKIREELISSGYGSDEKNALKILGVAKGLEIAINLRKRYTR